MRSAGLATFILVVALARAAGAEPDKPAKTDKSSQIELFSGIVMDDNEAEFTGTWQVLKSDGALAGSSHHDGNRLKGQNSARFKVKIPEKGKYIVRFAYTVSGNRASNVPITVEHAEGSTTITVDERIKPERHFVTLGLFTFAPDKPAVVTIGTAKTDGYVSVDGLQFVLTKD